MTDWLTAIGILLSGLIIGSLVVFGSRRKKAAPSDGASRRVLELQRDALLERLRALDDTETDDRTRLENEAASVLRALDRTASASDSGATTAPVRRRPSSALIGFLSGSAAVVAIAAALWYVAKPPAPNVLAAPQPVQEAEAAAVPQAGVTQTDTPEIEVRLDQAKSSIDRGDYMAAFEQTKAVLAANPDEPRALTYQAIVRIAMGQHDAAKQLLDSVTTKHPQITDAWIALALLRTEMSDSAGAAQAIEQAIRQHPDDAQRLRSLLAQMQGAAAGQPMRRARPAA